MKVLSVLGVLALFMSIGILTAPAANATGGGSDDPTPYTVDVNGITLPEGVTFPDGGHVNIKTTQGNPGIQFESLNQPDDSPKKIYIGKSFIPWSAFGLTGDFCVKHVQVSMYNQHYGEGGQPAVCISTTPPPTPKKDATASVEVDQQASCTGPSTVKFTIENATWDVEPDPTVGTHIRLATANEGHLFANGEPEKGVSYTIEAQKPTQSTDPRGDCYVPPVIAKDATASVEVKAAASCTSTTQVDFAIKNATWDTEADLTVGTHTRTATATEGHQFSDGTREANVTYTIVDKKPSQSTDPSGDCYVPPTPPIVVDNNPDYDAVVSCKQVTITFSNSVELSEDEITEPVVYTYTDAEGEIQEVSVAANKTVVVTVAFEEDTGEHIVTVGVKGEEQEKLTVLTDCEPNSFPLVIKVEASFTDECGVEKDSINTPGTFVKGTSSVEPEGDSVRVEEYETDQGTYYSIDSVTDGVHTGEVYFVPSDPNAVIVEPTGDDTYTLEDNVAVWQHTFNSEACLNEPPTPPTTPQPEPSVAPIVPQKPSGTTPTETSLASTGAEVNGPIYIGAILLLLGGAFVATTTLVRRRKSAHHGE